MGKLSASSASVVAVAVITLVVTLAATVVIRAVPFAVAATIVIMTAVVPVTPIAITMVLAITAAQRHSKVSGLHEIWRLAGCCGTSPAAPAPLMFVIAVSLTPRQWKWKTCERTGAGRGQEGEGRRGRGENVPAIAIAFIIPALWHRPWHWNTSQFGPQLCKLLSDGLPSQVLLPGQMILVHNLHLSAAKVARIQRNLGDNTKADINMKLNSHDVWPHCRLS